MAAFVLALGLSGCGTTQEKDETAGKSPQEIFSEAKELSNSGSYDAAIKLFERLEARYPFGRYAQQAQLEIAYAYYRSYDQASAIAACDRFIKLHPNHPNVDYAYYLKGLASFNDQSRGLFGAITSQDITERDPKASREAYEAFREVFTRFPDSRYAEDAGQRAAFLINALAANEIHVARYYMKRRAPLAAVNRAKVVVQSFGQTPSVEEALYIMVKGYDQLNLPELRDDTRRVLAQNFPSSTYLTELADAVPPTPWWQIW